jgi:hypothetical protein
MNSLFKIGKRLIHYQHIRDSEKGKLNKNQSPLIVELDCGVDYRDYDKLDIYEVFVLLRCKLAYCM